MTSERASAVFEAAILREPSERMSFLRDTCAGDRDLMAQVESMLTDAEGPLVIDRPVDEVVTELLDDTPVVIGTQLGAYRVESLLGTGGMGAVYRATDTVLSRQVAIKMLPSDMATDPEWIARFHREAQALAALNHPNVGAIFGFETLNGPGGPARGLVLELVEGPTLAETLQARPLPVDETLAIASQIAEALSAAHQQGIVHRDLKPGNIKVREDGTVKVLDFGLATIGDPSSLHEAEAGLIVGTPAYMSPEQAKGQPVTRTTDIWAFGCVLYEMLAGKPAFVGGSARDTLAAIVQASPDFGRLPPETPAAIRTLLSHCLNKDPRRRWPDAASLRIVIDDARAAPSGTAVPEALARVTRRRTLTTLLALVATVAVSALAVWNWKPQAPQSPVARVLVGVSPASQIGRSLQFPNARPFRSAIALSPDGQSLAFLGTAAPGVDSTERQLYVRRLDRLDATPFPGTERAESVFFSPDGRWIGFWQAGADPATGALVGELKKVPVAGGPIVTLCRAELPAGISWAPNGRIVFAKQFGGGLWQVTDSGGTPEALTTPDAAKGEVSHRLPHVLPDGSAVLFTIQRSAGEWDDAQVAVRSQVTGETKVLLEGGVDARYVTSGHIVYARRGTLLAQRFDAARLAVSGAPVGVVDDVMHDVNTAFAVGNSGAAQFSVASDGTLAYLAGGVAPEGEYVPVWRDERGVEVEAGVSARSVTTRPRVSPDGRRIAFAPLEGIGIFDVARRSSQLLTSVAWGPSAAHNAPERRFLAWHPDGDRVTFTGADGDLYWTPVDGSGAAQRLTTSEGDARSSPRVRVPTSWSPDGRTLLFTQRPGASLNRDIWMLSRGDSGSVTRPFLETPTDEPWAEISPDGRFIVYESKLSGQSEIYVQRFPEAGRRELVSIDGGAQPMWARDGRALFYRASGPARMMRMMMVDVTLGEPFTVGRPRVLWEAPSARYPGGTGGRTYDLSPDGRRFLMTLQRDPTPQPPVTHIALVQHWFEELNRLVPAK